MIYTIEDAWKNNSVIFIFAIIIGFGFGLIAGNIFIGIGLVLTPIIPIWVFSSLRTKFREDGMHISGKSFTNAYMIIFLIRILLITAVFSNK